MQGGEHMVDLAVRNYWAQKLQGELTIGTLPIDNKQNSLRPPQFHTVLHRFSSETSGTLLGIANNSLYALFMVLLSGTQYVLYRYAGRRDIVMGMPLFMKHRDEVTHPDLILPLKSDIQSCTGLKQLLLSTKKMVQEATEHLHIAPSHLHDLMMRDDERLPNMHTVMLMSGIHDAESMTALSARAHIILYVTSTDKGIELSLTYNANLYEQGTVLRFANHVETFLTAAAERSDTPFDTLELMGQSERDLILKGFNQTAAPVSCNRTIHGLFEEQAMRTPEEIALVCADQALSYHQLNKRANQLAHYLRDSYHLQTDDLVGVMLDRTESMVVALYAILKAGAAYVPLDPTYPAHRLDYIIADSGLKVLITESNHVHRANVDAQQIVLVDKFEATDKELRTDNIAAVAKSDHLAYVIYTSGSTGNPKGVEVPHCTVLNFFAGMNRIMEATETKAFLSLTSISFDISVIELFWTLTHGIQVILKTDDEVDGYGGYDRYLSQFSRQGIQPINMMQITPSRLKLLTEDKDSQMFLQALDYLLVGGEALPLRLVETVQSITQARIFNFYGPTETTVYSTCCEVLPGEPLTIGKPIVNTQIYILDDSLQPVPIGVIGEIYIGGAGVSRGYRHLDKLTSERFIRNPFQKAPGEERLYRTGDLGRFLVDGQIEYLGRSDFQIKIRGYRIEMDEIEYNLMLHDDVREAVVVDQPGEQGITQLVAVLVMHTKLKENDMRAYLQERLPAYMVPTTFAQVEQMPLTPNGKTDRKALREMLPASSNAEKYIAPRTTVEETLTKVWSEVLNIPLIGIDDNFFILGGNSLKAGAVVSKLRSVFQVNFSIRELFNAPTIRELAPKLNLENKEPRMLIERAQDKSYYPTSSSQKRLFFQNSLTPNETSYHMPGAVTLRGPLNKQRLEWAFKQLVRRHDIFRTSIEMVNGELVQRVLADVSFNIEYMDSENQAEYTEALRQARKPAEYLQAIRRLLNAFVQPFSSFQAPLLRVGLIAVDVEHHLLVYDMHHIVSDGASMFILNEEFTKLYAGEELPELRIQYKDYAVWQQRQLLSERMRQQEQYWMNELHPEIPALNLATDFPRPAMKSMHGGDVYFEIDQEISDQITRLANQTGSTLNMVLLAAFMIMLSKYSGQSDIMVGSPIEGRQYEELTQTIGMFINMIVLRNQPTGEKPFLTFLSEIKNSVLQAYDNQQYPFEELVEKLNVPRDTSRSPLFDVMFSMQQASHQEGQIGALHFLSHALPGNISKFDLTLEVAVSKQGLQCRLEYCSDLFRAETALKMAQHYVHVLQDIMNDPNRPISQLNMLSAGERQQLLCEFNDTHVIVAENQTIVDQFREIAERMPEKIALVCAGRELTYQKLSERVHRLSYCLNINSALQPDDRIGILMDRSEHMVIALLAVLHAGAAYVPIDSSYPEERIAFIIADSQMKLLITESKHKNMIHSTELPVMLLDQLEMQSNEISPDCLERAIHPSDMAYMIYTSGSTGQPKGVMVQHGNVINFFAGMDQKIASTEEDALLALTSISFDISVLEIFWTLTRGITVVLKADEEDHSYDHFDQYVAPTTAEMDFSLFFFSSYSSEEVNGKYDLLVDSVKFADKHDFTGVWTPERHFHAFGGLFPNPSVVSAALAMVTDRIKIRAGSVVLPLHDPLRVAEEWSVVDNLSGGRVELAFATGWHPDDFLFRPEQYEKRVSSMYGKIEEVRNLWQGGKVERLNGTGNRVFVGTFPRPLSDTLPIWITTGGNPESFIRAGKIGAHVLTHLLGQDIDSLQNNIRLYRSALAENGHDPQNGQVALMVHTYLGEQLDEVEAIVKKPFSTYIETSADLLNHVLGSQGGDLNAISESDKEELLELAFQRYWQTSALMGTPETCKPLVERLHRIGVTEIACLVDFGVDYPNVMAGLERLSTFKTQFKRASQEQETINSNRAAQSVTMLQTTPSRLKMLMADPHSASFLQSLETIMIGGEPLQRTVLDMLRERTQARVFNMYGPTETTIWSSVAEVRDGQPILIGNPIANTQIYILDDSLMPVPIGVAGEIYIAGAGVARGYFGREELTSDRFISNPFAASTDVRMYKTGDLGRFMPDGSIECLGRKDFQVKIRGYRIEIEEIEAVMREHPAVREAAIMVRKDLQDDHAELGAYVVWWQEPKITEVRAYLSKRLPHYMIPSGFMSLFELPLTPNGKLDRSAFEGMRWVAERTGEHVLPRNHKEETLVNVWQEVLGIETIGIHDNFFELGGDSIKTIQVASKLAEHGMKIDVVDLFQMRTIEQLSPHVKMLRLKTRSNEPVTGESALTPIQRWFFAEQRKDSHHYNHAVMLHHPEGFDERIVSRVFDRIVVHHDALRSIFKWKNDQYVQHVRDLHSERLYSMETFDFRHMSDTALQIEAAANELQENLNLTEGPLVALGLFKADDGDHLLIVIHHLVIDGISWRIIFEDFAEGYAQALRGDHISFPAKTDSFMEWSEQLLHFAGSKDLLLEAAYWEQIESSEVLALPKDRILTESLWKDNRTIQIRLSAINTQHLLRDAHKAYNTEINDLLLTALGLSIATWKSQSGKVLLHLEGHGRESIADNMDVMRTVGWFTSLYPIVLDMQRWKELSYQIKYTKETLRKVPRKGIGYGLLKYLTPQPESGIDNFRLDPELIFNYLGQFDQDMQSEFLRISPHNSGFAISRNSKRQYALEINGFVAGGCLQVNFDYDIRTYDTNTIECFADSYKFILEQIIDHCMNKEEAEVTPSDLGNDELSIEELEQYLQFID